MRLFLFSLNTRLNAVLPVQVYIYRRFAMTIDLVAVAIAVAAIMSIMMFLSKAALAPNARE